MMGNSIDDRPKMTLTSFVTEPGLTGPFKVGHPKSARNNDRVQNPLLMPELIWTLNTKCLCGKRMKAPHSWKMSWKMGQLWKDRKHLAYLVEFLKSQRLSRCPKVFLDNLILLVSTAPMTRHPICLWGVKWFLLRPVCGSKMPPANEIPSDDLACWDWMLDPEATPQQDRTTHKHYKPLR